MKIKKLLLTALAFAATFSVNAETMNQRASDMASGDWLAVPMSGQADDLATVGELVYAHAAYGFSGDATTANIAFAKTDANDFQLPFGSEHNAYGSAGLGESAYRNLMNYGTYGNGGNSFTLKKLTAGETYLVQLVFHDGRNENMWRRSAGCGEQTVYYGAGNPTDEWYYGGTLLHMFTATSDTYSFTLTYSSGANQVNAMQLRRVPQTAELASLDCMVTQSGISVSALIAGAPDGPSSLEIFANGVSVEKIAVAAEGVYDFAVATSDTAVEVKAVFTSGDRRRERTVNVSRPSSFVVVDDLSELADGAFFEGDAVVLPAGTYSVYDDAFASVDRNIVFCRKSGLTYLNDGAANYRFRVIPQALPGGDVFFFEQTEQSASWSTAAWINKTGNTGRSVPNNENDIAVVNANCKNNWAAMRVDGDVLLHGYVLMVDDVGGSGTSWAQFNTASGGSVTFCGTADDPAYFRMSGEDASNDLGIRLGQEKGTGNGVLTINLETPSLLFDYCGASAGAATGRNKINLQHCSAVVNVGEGQKVCFVNGSMKKEDQYSCGNTSVGKFTGAGEVEMGVIASLTSNVEAFFDGVTLTSCGNLLGRGVGARTLPGGAYKIRGGSRGGIPQTSLALGFDGVSVGFPTAYRWGSNPGDILNGADFDINGGLVVFSRSDEKNWLDNYKTAHPDVEPTPEQELDILTFTNHIGSLTLNGSAAMACGEKHNRDGDNKPRVRTAVIIDSTVNNYGGMQLYGMNLKATDGENRTPEFGFYQLKDFRKHIKGRFAADGENPKQIYPVIPWMSCCYNRATCQSFPNNTGSGWGNSMTLCSVDENGIVMNPVSPSNPNQATVYSRLDSIPDGINAIFVTDNGSNNAQISSDKTFLSLCWGCNNGTYQYAKQDMGAGRKITITSGALVFGGNVSIAGHSVGRPQELSKAGTLEFGDVAYVTSAAGYIAPGDLVHDWNAIFAACLAPHGFVKCGFGDMVLGADQTGIEKFIIVNSGTLWLGYPGKYLQTSWLYANNQAASGIGCATDVDITLRGATLGVPAAGYNGKPAISRNAVLTLESSGRFESRVEIAAGADQTCEKLYISGLGNGKAMARGTYGASGSGADFIDDVHFAGTGVLAVRKDDLRLGLSVIVR